MRWYHLPCLSATLRLCVFALKSERLESQETGAVLVDDDRMVSAAIDDDWLFVRGGKALLGAGAERALVESALEAELPRVAGDLVAEHADVVHDRLELGCDVLGVGQRPLQPEVEGRIVEQAAERSFAAVEVVGEGDELFEQLVDVGQTAVEVIDELRAALAQ